MPDLWCNKCDCLWKHVLATVCMECGSNLSEQRELNKIELTLIYDFIGRQALPYDNYDLHLAVEKLRRIVETNELDK